MVTSTSLCEAILEREAEETRDCTDINWARLIECERALWLVEFDANYPDLSE